jgi:hypothetical protein
MDPDKQQALDVAWLKRKELWVKGSTKIKQGNSLWSEIKLLPGAQRISVWFSISEMSLEAAQKVKSGYADRADGDKIWHDAVVMNCGPFTKVTWSYDDKAGAYDCTLESGEVFKA